MFTCEEGPFCSSGLPPTGDSCPEIGDVCCQVSSSSNLFIHISHMSITGFNVNMLYSINTS